MNQSWLVYEVRRVANQDDGSPINRLSQAVAIFLRGDLAVTIIIIMVSIDFGPLVSMQISVLLQIVRKLIVYCRLERSSVIAVPSLSNIKSYNCGMLASMQDLVMLL